MEAAVTAAQHFPKRHRRRPGRYCITSRLRHEAHGGRARLMNMGPPITVEVATRDDRYLSIRQLAAYGGLSVRTLRTYLTHPVHPLPCYRVGGKVLVRRSEYDSWMSRFRASGVPFVNDVVADVMRGLV